jgi:hypothetical protein
VSRGQCVGGGIGRGPVEPRERRGVTELRVRVEHRDRLRQRERLGPHRPETAEHAARDGVRCEAEDVRGRLNFRLSALRGERPQELPEKKWVTTRDVVAGRRKASSAVFGVWTK